MNGGEPSIFDGIPPARLTRELRRLERRTIPRGKRLITEGQAPAREVYIIQSGRADVYTTDRLGRQHLLNRLAAGATLGEMSLLTGEPATATVEAEQDLDLLVLSEADFRRIATRFPRIYQNLGSILAHRLARTNRQAARREPGRITLLTAHDSPPLLGYALACSLAWHTRGPVLHLLIADAASADLVALGERRGVPSGSAEPSPGAYLLVAEPSGEFEPALLTATLHHLCQRFDHVLVQIPAGSPPGHDAHTVYLRSSQEPDAGVTGAEPGHTLRGWSAAPATGRPDRDGVLHAPAPAPADEQAMRGGMLPPATPCGRALGWLARDLAGLKVGLALGAGAVKGYAHVGVLHVLDQHGIPIDFIAGTSIGAAVAAFYAAGFDRSQMPAIMDDVGRSAFRLAFSTTSLLSATGLRTRLQQLLGQRRIEETQVPLAIVAADIYAHQEVVFRRGLIWPAMLASMALPGIYPPVRMGRHTLVDGGVLNPVPGNVTTAMGADVVIAVKLANRPTPAGADAEAVQGDSRAGTMVQAITGAVELMQTKIMDSTAASATILIQPAFAGVDGYGLRRFSQGNRFIAVGERAAEEAMPQIAAALPWLR